jgi:hypothetical protein
MGGNRNGFRERPKDASRARPKATPGIQCFDQRAEMQATSGRPTEARILQRITAVKSARMGKWQSPVVAIAAHSEETDNGGIRCTIRPDIRA